MAVLSKWIIHGFAVHRLRTLEAAKSHLPHTVARIEVAASICSKNKNNAFFFFFFSGYVLKKKPQNPKTKPNQTTVGIKSSITKEKNPFTHLPLLRMQLKYFEVFASISEITVTILVSRLCTSLKKFGSSAVLSPHAFGTEEESRLTTHLEV